MKVRVYPGDRRAVGHIRLIWPADAVATDSDIDVEILHAVGRNEFLGPLNADVLVFQRPSHPELVAMIPDLQARGYAIVVDVDDDIAALPTGNLAYGKENHRLILRACAHADLVTVTTPPLARRYAPHGRVVVLPNCLPQRTLNLAIRDRDSLTVGWGGWVGTHPGDLEATRGGVSEALRRTGARFQVIGPGDDVQRRLALDTEPTATGPLTNVAALKFEDALGLLDVGIVPLAETTFNEAKSNLKGLQYAARGVPFVASPLPEYRRLAAEGAGILAANRGRNWRAQLVDLLTNPQRRAELAASGRQLVADQYTIQGNAWRWAEAWQAAFDHHRAGAHRKAAA